MTVRYGPPGAKGVTSLMAVGADEYESALGPALKLGGLAALALWGVGAWMKSQTAKNIGVGAGLALLALSLAARPARQVSVVQPPAAAQATGCVTCLL